MKLKAIDVMEEASWRQVSGQAPSGTRDNLEKQMLVRHVLRREGPMIRYEYDFGASWRLQIILQKILSAGSEDAAKYTQLPVCVGGRLNSPPEDGITPSDQERAEAGEPLEDADGERIHTSWDPKHFDKMEVNARLRHVHLYSTQEASSWSSDGDEE